MPKSECLLLQWLVMRVLPVAAVSALGLPVSANAHLGSADTSIPGGSFAVRALASAVGFDQEIERHGSEQVVKSVSRKLDDQLDTIADRIRGQIRKTTSSIAAIGRDLMTVKGILLFGEFLPWLKREFGMSPRTAAQYMNIAKLVAKDKSVLLLPLRTVRLLASPSTPEVVRSEILGEVKSGVTKDFTHIHTKIMKTRGKELLVTQRTRCPKCGHYFQVNEDGAKRRS